MAAHTSHRGQLGVLRIVTRLTRVLMHDIGKVDPLISVTIPILCRIRGCSWDLADTSHLRVVSAHKHRGLAMARAR